MNKNLFLYDFLLEGTTYTVWHEAKEPKQKTGPTAQSSQDIELGDAREHKE